MLTNVQRKARHLIRFSDQIWKKICREAKADGLAPPEHVRRIVDMHYLRGSIEQRHAERIALLEDRMSVLYELRDELLKCTAETKRLKILANEARADGQT